MNTFVPWPGKPHLGYTIDPDTGCHIWQGARTPYPQVLHEGVVQYVHRIRYEAEVGPIPDGVVLDHYVCDNGPGGCCNPEHCRPATHRENVLRGDTVTSRNAAKTHCPRGHELTEENVRRGLYLRTGWRSCLTCARAYDRRRNNRRMSR